MLFKLSLSNIRKSLRDYAIYFFTLIIGVSLFYVFNTIGGQAAGLKLSQSAYFIIELLNGALSATSVGVAAVLGLLIVYASRFLMKRRSREFALYLMLGMDKWKISAILLTETLIIGAGSLILGLVIGIGLSQFTSALVANLFEADMSAYKFSVSADAIVKTILCFAVMYIVVMLFNTVVITNMKLIDLMQSDRRSEQVKIKKPAVCIAVFIAAVLMLAYAYYKVGWDAGSLNRNGMIVCIVLGIIATFLVFWSVSGMLLRAVRNIKGFYHRGLNSFTFRQISSRINTTVFSMTVICLMLFVTICTLTSAFSIRNSMNSNIRYLCPVDFQGIMMHNESHRYDGGFKEMCEEAGYDITADFSEYVCYSTYMSPDLTYGDTLGSVLDEAKSEFVFIAPHVNETIMTLSEYNALMQLYGRETLSFADDEYAVICNYKEMTAFRNKALKENDVIHIFGHTLKSAYETCIDGSMELSTNLSNTGIYIIPDAVADASAVSASCLIGNYSAEEKAAADDAIFTKVMQVNTTAEKYGMELAPISRIMLKTTSIGLGAVVTFLGMYIGMVFLIACGAILALKQLSDSADSIGRYEMLGKIGAEEKDICRSVFAQTGIFFLLPLILAAIHSVFGMKFSIFIMQAFGTERVGESVAVTSLILLLIYGGYFLVTYICGKNVIKERR